MSDRMIPQDMTRLADWIFGELDMADSVFGIPESLFFVPGDHPHLSSVRFGSRLETPIGVAAGPHSQLTQNIIAAWLTGARFIELKTVQVLDELAVPKPCIDMHDVGYNCEWSQELRITESYDEYLKAWILIHALRKQMGHQDVDRGCGTIFNMSVGYDLEGIQSPSVQAFIARMRNATERMQQMLVDLPPRYRWMLDLDIPQEISNNVTLSTMHGCPPDEIGRIAAFLMTEMGLHTTVKFNPTLLGPDRLRQILHTDLGYDDIEVPDEAFEHDPSLDDAVAIIRSLSATAETCGVDFGIKLSNTLETRNIRGALPAAEETHYMSGRALHPLVVQLASTISAALKGHISISFAGGADAFNVSDLVACGLAPVTASSDLLKPGGYGRIAQYVDRLSSRLAAEGAANPDPRTEDGRKRLAAYAEDTLSDERYHKKRVPLSAKTSRPLRWFDCIAAPCRSGCPANQNIPDYLYLVAHDRLDEAMRVILAENPLPGITGCVCDHPCSTKCVRSNYDQPVLIRSVKRFVADHSLARSAMEIGDRRDTRVAIMGAGPAGLSCAYYLARHGMRVTIFDARQSAGGIPASIIPPYRLSDETVRRDVEAIAALGVTFEFGRELGRNLNLVELEKDGFDYFFLAVGASHGRQLGIDGESATGVHDCLDFLERARRGEDVALGRRVLVIGGGNSAMDAARSAWRLSGSDGHVTVVYRRTVAQMPADEEEIEALFREGIDVLELHAPTRVDVNADGSVAAMVCQRNVLGEEDASGRRRPVPVEGSFVTLEADSIIVAISQSADVAYLAEAQIALDRAGNVVVDEQMETGRSNVFAGGDAVRGASSIIRAAADGRHVAEEIARREGIAVPGEQPLVKTGSRNEYLVRRARRRYAEGGPADEVVSRRMDVDVTVSRTPEQARDEAALCLDCDEFCGLCQTVCPNRANLIYEIEPTSVSAIHAQYRDGQLQQAGERVVRFEQVYQIVNLAEFCNMCGNCKTFCPAEGAPTQDKPRLCLSRQGFDDEETAFFLKRTTNGWELRYRVDGQEYRLVVTDQGVDFHTPKVTAIFDPSLTLLSMTPTESMSDGEDVDLTLCAEMWVMGRGLVRSVPYVLGDVAQ